MICIDGLSDLTLLKHQPRENKSNQTPSEQIDTVLGMLPDLIARQGRAFASSRGALPSTASRVSSEDLTDVDRAHIKRTYDLPSHRSYRR